MFFQQTEFPWIVAVGASGVQGLDDLRNLLGALPWQLRAIVLVVLHRSWAHQSHLSEVLQTRSPLPVVVACAAEHLAIGTVYIGLPAEHLVLTGRNCGALVRDPGRTYRNRTVDLLFKSVSAHAGTRAIGVVLAGALDDGSRGLAAIHHAGGMTMVRSPSPQRGMPENAIAFDGPVSMVGSPREIGMAIGRLCAPQPWETRALLDSNQRPTA